MSFSAAERADVDLIEPAFITKRFASMLLPDHLRKIVAFVGIKENGTFKPKATGFYAYLSEHGVSHGYLVTAEHVVYGLLTRWVDIWVSNNLNGGGIIDTQITHDHWFYHPDKGSTDVAVCPMVFSGNDDALTVDFTYEYPEATPNNHSHLATKALINYENIGIGDEIAIIGLFRSHYGREKNVPIVRIGNISAMNEEPVFTKYCGFVDAYLVEARSISGLSGSPVFVNMAPYRTVKGSITSNEGHRPYYLLGLMHGHFDVTNLTEDMVTDVQGDSTTGVNTGIGVIIPVQKIIDTIRQPNLVELRKKTYDELRSKKGATSD